MTLVLAMRYFFIFSLIFLFLVQGSTFASCKDLFGSWGWDGMRPDNPLSFTVIKADLPEGYGEYLLSFGSKYWRIEDNLWDGNIERAGQTARGRFRSDVRGDLEALEGALLKLERELNSKLPEATFGQIKIVNVWIGTGKTKPKIHQDGVLRNGKPREEDYLRATLDLTDGGTWVGTENRYSALRREWRTSLRSVPVLGVVSQRVYSVFTRRSVQKAFETAVEKGHLFQVGRGRFFVFSQSWRPTLLAQYFEGDIRTRSVEHSPEERENGVVVGIDFKFFPN